MSKQTEQPSVAPKSKESTPVDPTQRELTEDEMRLNYEEFFRISRRLESHHAVFYQLWELGSPFFTKDVPTAAVRFDKLGECIQFIFNPHFWMSLNEDQKAFIISHECLHVILKHGLRMRDSQNREACNVSMDVVINELLLEQFGFKQTDIDPEGKYCWLNTIFKKPTLIDQMVKGNATKVDIGYGEVRDDIEPNESFEYYFNRLPSNYKMPQGHILVDIHDFLDGTEGDFAIDKLGDSLSDEEKESIREIVKKFSEDQEDKEGKNRGDQAGGGWKFMDKKRVAKKRKWETVIKKWSMKFLRNDFDTFEHWARVSRRLVEMPQDVILPTEMELQEKEDEGKVLVYFFLDTSGSCAHLAERFWKASKSLPKERFEKRLFCFDTKVYEVDEKVGKLYGFGGTSFDIIEEAIQKHIKQETNPTLKKYPQAVFIITDGYGNAVKPAKPENWYWFLTEYSSDSLIDKKCKKFKLKDFE